MNCLFILLDNVGVSTTSISMIKSNVIFSMGLRDYNEIGVPIYIWKFGFPLLCDIHDDYEYILKDHHKYTIYKKSNFKNIQNGDIIWLKDGALYDFIDNIYPHLNNNTYFSIFSASNHDWTIPSRWNHSYLNGIKTLLHNDQILHWFAENYDAFYFWDKDKRNVLMEEELYSYKYKFSIIPIGLDFHNSYERFQKGVTQRGHYDTPMQQFNIMQNILNNRERIPFIQDRRMAVYVDYTLNAPKYRNNRYARWLKYYFKHQDIFKDYYYWTRDLDKLNFKRGPFRAYVYYRITMNRTMENDVFKIADKRLNQYVLFEERSKYVFLLSIAGNGLDCFRTWEGILFGNIIIVQTSPLDQLYIDNNFPVVIINDWDDINKTMLNIWYKQYKHLTYFENYETRQKMTLQFWMAYMRNITHHRLKELNVFR